MVNPDQFDENLRASLRPRRVPSPDVAWQRLQPSLGGLAPRSRTGGHAVRVGAGVLVAILATMSIALASSPDLRQQLTVLVGMASAGNRVSALQPPPPFTVFQPTDLPEGMRLVAQSYNPGPASNGQSSWSTAGSAAVAHPAIEGASASRVGSAKPDQQVEAAARRRAQELLGTAQRATLVLVYANPSGQLVAVVEQSAVGRALPAGDLLTIGRAKGTVSAGGGETIVSWIAQNTFLQVHSTIARAKAAAFANRLEPTSLDGLTQTEAAVALRALPTPVPLAERVAAIETPTIDPAAVVQKCGRWDPGLSRTAPTASYDQAICVARAIVGIDQRGGYGLSRYHWHEAAARLGLDPSVGPRDDPTVWLAEVEDWTEGHGWIVVLDAQTGQPDLVVRLKSVQAQLLTQRSVAPSQP